MPPGRNGDNGGVASRNARVARDETIMSYSGLVRSIARRYEGRGLALDDLIQVGYIGLIHAVDRFDPARGASLRAYAARTIDGEIMHMFRDQKWAVRVPRGLQESSSRVALLHEELTQQLGREPTLAEVAQAAGLSVEETDEAIAVRTAFTTRAMPEHARPVESDPDVASEDEFGSDDQGFDTMLDRVQLAAAMRSLPARERRILVMRVYGDLTQSEIADRIGISQMHVSRLLSHARSVVCAHLAGEAA
jgi:RNA polymerase sigma-B factor